ncbi:HAD family hydrolase [Palleronia sediminis]|uniref:HAD family hydrolase n=1 Tax=Palleronia sediminis TaxID=2547833 RepID=UPI001455AF2A|nr:HAD-IA family hydrolase [Palleronia sediminis]
MPGIALTVWDYDGVLNREPDGPFPWVATLERDLGIRPEAFRRFLNDAGRKWRILRGEEDLLAALNGWLGDGPVTGRAFLDHWLRADDRPDPETFALLSAQPHRAVIGTNNEAHRARAIEARAAGAVEAVFASGPMGVAKPDPGFFRAIEDWAGLAPSRILLIDDSPPNCRAAAERGWQTFRFGPETRHRLAGVLGL